MKQSERRKARILFDFASYLDLLKGLDLPIRFRSDSGLKNMANVVANRLRRVDNLPVEGFILKILSREGLSSEAHRKRISNLLNALEENGFRIDKKRSLSENSPKW